MENAAQDAQDRIREESEEWDVADVEGDGGIPVAVSKASDDQRNDVKKGAPKTNHARKEFTRRKAKQEASNAVASSGAGPGKENPKASYKPVTEWGPSANIAPHGQQNNKSPKSPAKPKEPSARMKARMALLNVGEDA